MRRDPCIAPPLDGTAAPELRRLRKELARKRREPIRIIITTDPTRSVRTLKIPRSLPAVLLAGSAVLLMTSIGLSFSTWSMSGTVAALKSRVVAMMQMADTLALQPPSVAHAATLEREPVAGLHIQKPTGGVARFTVEAGNANEKVEVVLDLAKGEVDEPSYRALRHLMRCRRTGAEAPIDPRLIETLYGFAQRTGQHIILISGFRTPAFAAPSSYHTRGMAADIRIPGMTALMVRDLARAMGVRGIGYYPRSQFVHVDMREESYSWTETGTAEGAADPELESEDEAAVKAARASEPVAAGD